MYILGISAFYHDSAACLVKDGKLLSAAQEERFTRKKHDNNFPQKAIKFCLNDGICNVESYFNTIVLHCSYTCGINCKVGWEKVYAFRI